MYCGSSTDKLHFNKPYQLDDVIPGASNNSISNDASVKDNEMDGEGLENGLCEADLHRVPRMLGDDHRQFERVVI